MAWIPSYHIAHRQHCFGFFDRLPFGSMGQSSLRSVAGWRSEQSLASSLYFYYHWAPVFSVDHCPLDSDLTGGLRGLLALCGFCFVYIRSMLCACAWQLIRDHQADRATNGAEHGSIETLEIVLSGPTATYYDRPAGSHQAQVGLSRSRV